jgi:hypothetical protein
MIRATLAANLAVSPIFAPRMPQLDAVAVGNPQHHHSWLLTWTGQ